MTQPPQQILTIIALGAAEFARKGRRSQLDFLTRATRWCLKENLVPILSERGFQIVNMGGDRGLAARFGYAVSLAGPDGVYWKDAVQNSVLVPTSHDRISRVAHALALEEALRQLFAVPEFERADLLRIAQKDQLIDLASPCITPADSLERAAIFKTRLAQCLQLRQLGAWKRENETMVKNLWKSERTAIWEAYKTRELALKDASRAAVQATRELTQKGAL